MAEQGFIFLDGDLERKQLITDIRKVRAEVLALCERVPEKEWYLPRYHGWSLAATLAHLNFMDNISLLLVRSAIFNIRLRLSPRNLDRLNRFMARLFQNRLISATIRSAHNNEARIADLIMNLPIDQFTKSVYYCEQGKTIMIEQALQAFFLHHWRAHLHIMLEVENNLQATASDKRDVD